MIENEDDSDNELHDVEKRPASISVFGFLREVGYSLYNSFCPRAEETKPLVRSNPVVQSQFNPSTETPSKSSSSIVLRLTHK